MRWHWKGERAMSVFATINFGDEEEVDQNFKDVKSLDDLIQALKMTFNDVTSIVLVVSV
jgi:hypothetical protein